MATADPTPCRHAAAPASAEPPFWLPLLAALPLAACLVALALPNLGHGAATWSRSIHLLAVVLWMVPLTAVQRALRRRGWRALRLALALFVITGAMALATRALVIAFNAWQHATPWPAANPQLLRGLEGPWLALVACAALHAVVAAYAELRHSQERQRQAQLLARAAELRALRLQLQPHLLFNTLNTIDALVACSQPRQARQMLARLGDFLRATLAAPAADEVTLAEELALAEAYLAIEQARLGDRLALQWQLGPGLLAARVPPQLCQPLVENAIRHGIAPRTGPGTLSIRAWAQHGRLCLEVLNDVPSPNSAAAAAEATRADAVGLRNVRERLAALYAGGHAGLEAGLTRDGRFRAAVHLPLAGAAP